MISPQRRIVIKPLLVAALTTAIVMTSFETLKQLIFPAITVWSSHVLTIIFTTLASVVITYLALTRYAAERNIMESEIIRLNGDLKIINQELEAFNHTVAHDLRQPLNILAGYCQMIEKLYGSELQQDCREYVREAYNCTLRMNRLIEALLNFSRMGQVEPRREMVDLAEMAREVIRALKLAEPERQVEVKVAESMMASAEPNLLRIVLENLLGNAWKYTGMREKAVIEVGAMECDGVQSYFVRDNGIGFTEADAAKVFTPFLRLAGVEEIRGFGIGLATAERIIRRHGGRMWAEGEPDRGATFYFTLSAKGP